MTALPLGRKTTTQHLDWLSIGAAALGFVGVCMFALWLDGAARVPSFEAMNAIAEACASPAATCTE